MPDDAGRTGAGRTGTARTGAGGTGANGTDAGKAGGAGWSPARARVYRYVRDGILDGRLPGGAFLEESEVSLAVGVSRTPVREAFQQLHGERLIDLVPRRGAMVRVVTVQELVEVYEARLMMERHAARRLCRERRPPPPAMLAALAGMQAGQGGGQGAGRRESQAASAALNTAFHQALVVAAGNGVITALYEALSTRQERVARTTLSLEPGREATILAEHRQLVAALAAHDAAAAEAILTEHLRPMHAIVARLPGSGEGAA